MSIDRFNWILDNYGKNIKRLSLTGGEPTLHPDFSEIVRSIKKRKIWLGISTNGTLISKKINDLRHIDKINVSLDGVNYSSFKKLRNGSEEQYNEILNGLRLLKEEKINFQLSFLLFEETLGEIKKITEFVREFKPTILNLHSGNPFNSKEFKPLVINSSFVRAFIKELTSKNDYPFSIKLPVVHDPDSNFFKEHICPKVWNNVYVGWNGDISYCCYLWPDPQIGNIFNGYNFNSSRMINFRRLMINKKLPPQCIFCQRRFIDSFSGYFDSNNKKWFLPKEYNYLIN